MRARDIRAIAFFVLSTAAVVAAAYAVLDRWTMAAPLGLAWVTFLCARPRMIRVFRRLRGERLEMRRGYFWD